MKNILRFVMLLFCFQFYGAQTAFGTVLARQSGTSGYLTAAANAWATVIGGVGPGGEIASYINRMHDTDMVKYLDAITIIAYNDTALGLFETNQHLDRAFSAVSTPLSARRGRCVPNLGMCPGDVQTLVIDGQVFASFSDFDSHHNGDFKTRNTGVSIRAKGYVADGWTFGVAYTRTMTDTRDNRVYTDATSNSITLFSQYLGKHGLFINSGINGGHTTWNADKTMAGIVNNSAYDTEFFAGQINAGIQLSRGRFSLAPQVGARYAYVSSDRRIDGAAQEFDKWWHNTLTAMAGVDGGFDFIGDDFVIRPTVKIGGSYDAISHGTDAVGVRVVSGHTYAVPIEVPHRAALNSGIGLNVYGASFMVGVNYQLDVRSDYVSHTAMANVKIAF